MFPDFEAYKREIDLVAFATQVYGFVVNRQKSTRREVVVQNSDQTETLIISRNLENAHFTYFNPQNEKDRGTIIDFSLFRNQGDWGKVRQELKSYREGRAILPEYAPDPETDDPPIFSVLPLSDRRYLHQRGISDETLDHPFFTGRIFNHRSTAANRAEYVNIAFPLYRNEQIVGLELKNEGYHGNAKGSERSSSCWMSRLPDADPQIAQMVISESAIDALSWHQLFPAPPDSYRIYLSMGGNITLGQRLLAQQLINQYRPEQIMLANDNDVPGILHNINLIGWLETELDRSRVLKASAYVPEPGNVLLAIRLQSGKEHQMLLAAVQQLFAAYRDAKGIGFTIREAEWEGESARIDIYGENSRENLEAIERYLIHLKGLQNQVQISRAIQKDFNEDLMAGRALETDT